MNTIIVFPGRFQPFGPHHLQVYKYLTCIVGPSNVYISTSNNIDSKSPLSFLEKLRVIQRYVPTTNIINCKNLYQPTELLQKFDPNNTIVIFAYSYKDYGRIGYIKKDGTPGYLQPFVNVNECLPYKDHSYVMIVPEMHIKYAGKDVSGSYIRSIFKLMSKDPLNTNNIKIFEKLFGYKDKDLMNLMMDKFK